LSRFRNATLAALRRSPLVFLFLWGFCFSEGWVRLAAVAYADRLIEATDTLKATRAPKKDTAPNSSSL
jgi:hypothetical protein